MESTKFIELCGGVVVGYAVILNPNTVEVDVVTILHILDFTAEPSVPPPLKFLFSSSHTSRQNPPKNLLSSGRCSMMTMMSRMKKGSIRPKRSQMSMSLMYAVGGNLLETD